jgi:phospholipase C
MRYWLLLIAFIWPFCVMAEQDDAQKLAPVNHIIVFYLENHSFDNLFGTFAGANGLANAGEKSLQLDANDKPYAILPAVLRDGKKDERFPANLPNKPFLISQYVPADKKTGDLVHRFYQNLEQINGGAMNKFVLATDAGALTMGYYDEKDSPIMRYAKNYTLADNFFVGAFGGSMLNHFWLVCACTPHFDNAPDTLKAVLDGKGHMVKDGPLTPDGYAVNTIQPFSPPFDPKYNDSATRLPMQDMDTIGERLNEKNISWAWYAGGWADADAGKPDKLFIYHHQPFAYFAKYAPGTEGRKKHLKDELDLVADIEKGTLPAVTFYKPIGEVDAHPGYARLIESEDHVFELINKIEKSPLWQDSIIIVTFDDTGGFWDHVAPPKGDRFGPGERTPVLVISPFAKRGFVDHTLYDTTSILKLIESKYKLKPLGKRDAKANNLLNTLQ